MRICVFWEYFQHYHCARVRALINASHQFGAELFPISISGVASGVHSSKIDSDIHEHVTILCKDPRENPMDSSLVSSQLLGFIKTKKIDVVFVIGWSSKISRAVVSKAKYLGCRVVLMLEGQKKDRKRVFWKEAYKRFYFMRKVDAVFCGGKTHASYARWLGFSSEKIFTGYDAVDNRFWSNLATKARLHESVIRKQLNLEQSYFVASGRFVEKKNFVGLLTAYAKYLKISNSPKLNLIIIGDGPLRGKIEATIDKYGLSSRVMLPGYLDPSEIAKFFSFAAAFIMSSSHYEQWGLVVNEAMACGLPVIVSDICGCAPDLLSNGKNGFTYAANDLDQLTDLMSLIGSNKIDLCAMGRSSSLIIEKYGLNQFTESFYKAAQVAIE